MFEKYKTIPIFVIAHQLRIEDVVEKVADRESTYFISSNSMGMDLLFKATSPVTVGDYIVYEGEGYFRHYPAAEFTTRFEREKESA
ncbi:hypothetical protein L4174_023675 (plasmid) [Photobacterium sp. CCB-ST2H9]|uniref:hypothetical protein n=1 Tax=Photobacterium sp. CCB-ST2H9 TaxID=2912855 RepID=UPI002004CA32|nr:hypothetical protein [Photobacterium sp. CCB-ST2H9]UTM60469.1 hypothetical protein L4174_023675 [Photobacterium sp. CCB-ST2H9]